MSGFGVIVLSRRPVDDLLLESIDSLLRATEVEVSRSRRGRSWQFHFTDAAGDAVSGTVSIDELGRHFGPRALEQIASIVGDGHAININAATGSAKAAASRLAMAIAAEANGVVVIGEGLESDAGRIIGAVEEDGVAGTILLHLCEPSRSTPG